MDAVVVAEGVQKSYGDTVALSSVSLAVERGEVFALIGPNGAGKTTLVRSLTGTTVPDGGSVRVLERSPTDVDRGRIGVLPQAFTPPARLTAREVLAYYAGLYDDARDPETVLADVGLADAGDTWYENLSGGQQRRVCVGVTLVNDPEILVLDEPTTGIDPAGRRTVWALLESLAASGTTILLTTHDMAEAQRLGDRVGLLADGELVATGTPRALIADHAGSSYLTVETSAEPTAFEDFEYPVEAGARDGELVVRDVSPAEIGRVVDELEEQDVQYTSLAWAEPDLEDVYLALAEDVEAFGTGGRPLETSESEGETARAIEPDSSAGSEPDTARAGGETDR